MPDHRISIIGLGVAQRPELVSAATETLRAADVVIASQRQFATVQPILGQVAVQHVLLPKLAKLRALIESVRDKRVVVLASGDPLYYGIGRWFSQNFSAKMISFYPAVSSIQAVCHRLGIALQDVDVLSLHGRPLEKLRTRLHKRKALLVLTDQFSHPQQLARECMAAGFPDSELVVCENLGYDSEQVRTFAVRKLCHSTASFEPLHISLINVAGEGGLLPEFPGIPDHRYVTGATPGKGMISKREVRLCILSLMQASAHDVIWDIGAGCGGVAVELAYWNETADIHAIECHPERLEYLEQNRSRFGVVANLRIVGARAPACLGALPDPDKIFVGGSDGELEALLSIAWQRLPEHGVMVCSAVMENSRCQLRKFASTLPVSQVECVEIGVKRGTFDSGQLEFEQKLPVQIYRFAKSGVKR